VEAGFVHADCALPLDGRVPNPYLTATMNRLLLTLLVLLTGLAAQVSPAQASVRASGESGIEAVQPARVASDLAQRVCVRAASPAGQQVDAERSATELPVLTAVVAAGVRIGIDRARE